MGPQERFPNRLHQKPRQPAALSFSTRSPTVDTFVCLLIEKQGGWKDTKGSRTQAGPAVLFQALTPAEGTQQRGAARPQLTRVGIRVARGRSAPSGPRPRRCPADSGLPHCGEARRASAGHWRAPDSAGAGTRGPRRAGAARTRRQGGPGWPECGPFPESLARLFPRTIGISNGRGAGARARDRRGRGGPSCGDAKLEGAGRRGPPGRSLPQRQRVRAEVGGLGVGGGCLRADLQ